MKPTLKIVIAMVIWGSLGIFIRFIELPPPEITFMRSAIAGIVLLVITRYTMPTSVLQSEIKHVQKNLVPLILSGFLLAGNWALLFQAYKYTTIANATLSYYLAPLIAVLLSPLFIKSDDYSWRKFIAIFIALGGLYLIISNQGSALSAGLDHMQGIAYGCVAAFLYAGVVICNKRIVGIHPQLRTVTQLLLSVIVILPLILIRGQLHFNDMTTVIFLLIVGLVHTALACTLYFPSIEHVSVLKVSVLSYIDPLTAMFFGFVFLQESLTLWQIVGGILILGSAFYSQRAEL